MSFRDKNNTEVDHVQVARWDDAFNVAPIDFSLKPNFKDIDPERVYIQIIDVNLPVTTNAITVTLESYDRGDDPLTASAIDQQEGIVLISNGANTYRSEACLLVTDNDMVDDNFPELSPSGNPSPIFGWDGIDDTGNDPTIYAVCRGKLKLTYNGVTKIIDVCDNAPKEVREVKLNIINMKNDEGSGTFFEPSEIMTALTSMQKTWAQCCIRFKDKNGGELDITDVVTTDKVSGVTLNNGLETSTTSNIAELDLTLEEETLLISVKDSDEETIDIIFINNSVVENTTSPSGVLGYAIIESLTEVSQIDPLFDNTVFITKDGGYFTPPHEIGHVLTNNGYYGVDYTGNSEFLANLMRGGQLNNQAIFTSPTNSVGSSKRLTPSQCEAARTETNLPQVEN